MSVTEWRASRFRHARQATKGREWTVKFDHSRALLDDHPTRPSDVTLRRIQRLATECTVKELGGSSGKGRYVAVDFHLIDVPGTDAFPSSLLFRRCGDGVLEGLAYRIRLPPDIVPEDVPEREAVEGLAELLAEVRPPVRGTKLFISERGIPHLAFGNKVQPHTNDRGFPAAAVVEFLADLKPVMETGGRLHG